MAEEYFMQKMEPGSNRFHYQLQEVSYLYLAMEVYILLLSFSQTCLLSIIIHYLIQMVAEISFSIYMRLL